MQLMGVADANQRRSPRRPVHVSGTISTGSTTHVAWIKDLNDSGICLFTNHSPALGELVRVTLDGDQLPANLSKTYEGTVIRVQDSAPGAALRVAITFGLLGAMMQSA